MKYHKKCFLCRSFFFVYKQGNFNYERDNNKKIEVEASVELIIEAGDRRGVVCCTNNA